MKYIVLIITLLSFNFQFFSQVEFGDSKVKWTFSIEQKDCEATLIANVKMVPNWHINAIVIPAGSFGYATSWSFQKSNSYKSIGAVSEPKPKVHFDEASGENLATHEGTVRFKQKIAVIDGKDFEIKGTYSFQTCNEEMCLPPFDGKFTLKVKACPDGKLKIDEDTSTVNGVSIAQMKDDKKQTVKPTKSVKPIKKTSKSLWLVFLLAFLSGFAALIMPCVFPMIPMTVSFFTKRSKTRAEGIRNAFLYGGSIILIHVLLGGIVVITGAGHILNELSTNMYFNLFFFAMLFAFGLSFLGAFEIQLPAKWTNAADEKADKGGIVGIFFMALVLSLASFSCTGPILGTLLGELSSSGGSSALMIGMFAFGLALAIPFMLFAIFPSWLNSLPSSGGWLNVVKVFLGFLEIAFAFKFLSTADTTMQWHLLEREVFIAIWVAIFGTLTMYLFGKIRLPHDSPVDKLSVGRSMFATLVLAFTIYLIPGLWGAPLKIVNAFLPPDFYSESPKGFGGGGNATSSTHLEEGMHEAALGLPAFKDYDLALAYAKKVNKPLFIDFTGWGCVNCRKMENTVWGEPGVIEHLQNDVVIVSLYVDERTELPKKEQKTIKLQGRDFSVLTVGNKWTAKQIGEFQNSSQPMYVMQSPEGKDLSNGKADYQNHSDPAKFSKWIKDGLKK